MKRGRLKGFAKFQMKIEGREASIPVHYDLPTQFNRVGLIFENKLVRDHPNEWINPLFLWSSSEQGHSFWNDIREGTHTDESFEEAERVLDSWRYQLRMERNLEETTNSMLF